MSINELMKTSSDEIISDANAALSRSELAHYKSSKPEQNKQRLQILFDLARQCIENKTLVSMLEYASKIAEERFQSGFDLFEVQTAFNVLEEIIWKKIINELPPQDYAEALGMISTVFGAGKDMLATTYVSLASKIKTSSMDYRALFAGTDGI